MSVTLISDSACDMSQQEAAALGVTILPMKTVIDGVEYLDGVTITSEEFYDKLEHCRTMPTTSQLTPADFADALEPVLDRGDEAVILTIAGRLSGTYQSACIAAADYPGRVWVVDSGNVTIGQCILLRYAIRLRERGLSGGEIARELERSKGRVRLLARVDTLEYLMKGGRLSRTAAIAGTLLQIKPVLSVEDGQIKVLGKARGSRQSGNMLTEFIQKSGGIDFSMPALLAFSGTDDALLKGYIENSRALWEDHLKELPPAVMIGSTISTHAGPGAIAVAFFAKS